VLLKIVKDKNKEIYNEYKYHYEIKFQLVINNENIIKYVSKSYNSNIHNKKLFISEYKNLCTKIDKKLSILEYKVYSGLKKLVVEIAIKRNNIKYKKNKDLVKSNYKNLSFKRIKIKILFNYITNLYNLQ
jgi:hypothetical protein